MSSPSTTTTPERDTQLLDIGKQCSAPSCLLVDFLPFKCQHCQHSFCSDHFLPEQHKCDKFDVSKHNRVAPSCPLCNTPVAVPLGQDPNIRMERHISSECSVMTGKSGKPSSNPHCADPKCRKILFAPILCNTCKQQFCPEHRFPTTHTCTDKTASVAPKSAFSAKTSASSAAAAGAMNALKRAVASASASTSSHASKTSSSASKAPAAARTTPAPQSQPNSTKPSSTSRKNPFSAVDRPPSTPLISQHAHVHAHDPDTTNDPPARCAPKPTSSSSNAATNLFLDPLSFVPPSLFASA